MRRSRTMEATTIELARGPLAAVLRGYGAARGFALRRDGAPWAQVTARRGPGWWRARLVAAALFTAAIAALIARVDDVSWGVALRLFGATFGVLVLARALVEWLGPGWVYLVARDESPLLLVTARGRRGGATVWEIVDGEGEALGLVVHRAARDAVWPLGPSSVVAWIEPVDGPRVEARREAGLRPAWVFAEAGGEVGRLAPAGLGRDVLETHGRTDARLLLAAAVVGRL